MPTGKKAAPCGEPDAPAAAPRFDKWKVLGPGGGGAQFFPAISPHDPDKVFAASDMSQGFASDDGGESWRMFNIRGAIRFFVFDPCVPCVAYARSGLGLFRTEDGGETWHLVHPAPENVARVVAVSDHAWERIATKDGSCELVEALAIDPEDSNTLYASMTDGAESSLHISRDRGATWHRTGDLPSRALRIFRFKGGGAVYAACESGVSVFDEGTWEHHGAPEGVRRLTAVAAGRGAGGVPLFYCTSGPGWRGDDESAAGVFKSHDAGASWLEVDDSIAEQFETPRALLMFQTVETCPADPDIAYLSWKVRAAEPGGKPQYMGVAKTVDAGENWRLVWKDSTYEAGPGMKDAWMNERFGPEWGENPFCLAVGADGRLVYATDFGRTLRTKDGGETWVGVYSRKMGGGWTSTGLDMTTCYGVHRDPHEPQRLWIDYTDIGAFVSDDGGVTWNSGTAEGVPDHWVNTTYWMLFDPEVKGRVWAVSTWIHDLPFAKMWKNLDVARYNGGVCVSDDGGRTWRRASEEMPETACTHIIMDPESPPESRTLYVTGFGTGVWKSTDGGASWALKARGLSGREPFAWRLTLDDAGALYLVVARRSYDGSYGTDEDGRLYRSRDAAETWQEVPLPEGVNGPMGLTVDPRDRRRLYLATWGRHNPEGDTDGGIWLSTDGGGSWERIFAKQQYIYDVTMDPRNPDILYAASMLYSVWRSADAGATWRRLKGYNFKQAKRVIVDPMLPDRIFVTTFGGSVWYGPATGDPDAAEDIVTPVVSYDIENMERQVR